MNGLNYLKATEPLRGDSLCFTIQLPGVPGTHWSTSEGWKAELILEPCSGFELANPGLGIQRLNH